MSRDLVVFLSITFVVLGEWRVVEIAADVRARLYARRVREVNV